MGHSWVEGDTADEQGGCHRRSVLRELKRVSKVSRCQQLADWTRSGQWTAHPLQQYSCGHDDLN